MEPTIPLEDVLYAGRHALSDLLKAGNSADLRDRFDRFSMWWVRQGILGMITNNDKNDLDRSINQNQ
ncbi:hypothetical protein GCM10011386_37110 [Parapedobacter defluvii]|uniref:Uncharacterized protein n=1 Tax=Parapedobacter defluvii TaxID=2045106 RepID=A0ABQ1MJF5_9SPHI|nr:hypothetical protein GCM10011386_37110 [Parapedobacter defluvii]